MKRAAIAVGLASALTFVMATHGVDDFQGARYKLVTGLVPAVNGEVRVSVDAVSRATTLRPPFAFIARIGNETADPQSYSIQIDGSTLCDATVAGHTAAPGARVDCIVAGGWTPNTAHEIAIMSRASVWSLQYLELATHEGASSGAYQLFVIPRDATPFVRPWPLEIAAFWLAMAALFWLPFPARMPRFVAWLYGVVAAVIGGLLVAVLLAPLASRYTIVTTWPVLARFGLVLAAPALWRLGARGVAEIRRRRQEFSALAWPALTGAVVLFAFGLVMTRRLESYNGNYSGFLQIGAQYVAENPLLANRLDIRSTLLLERGGYDGQFMYYGAFDPLMRAFADDPFKYGKVMDTAPYRYGRIGYIWLTRMASFGEWQRFPKTMVWLDLLAIFAVAVMIAIAAMQASASAAWGLLALLIPAFWQSLETALPEPVAAAFLVLGLLAWQRSRWLAASLILAASLLVRETGGLLVLILAGATALRGNRRHAVLMTLIAFAPFILWRLYVGWVLYPDWGRHGFFYNPGLLAMPFAGFAELWSHVASGQYEMALARSAHWLPVLLTALWALAVALVIARPSALTAAAAAYATIAVSLDYRNVWVHTRNAERVTYEAFVLIALASAAAAARSKIWRIPILAVWGLAAFYVFWVGFDAAFYRETILSPVW